MLKVAIKSLGKVVLQRYARTFVVSFFLLLTLPQEIALSDIFKTAILISLTSAIFKGLRTIFKNCALLQVLPL